MLPSPPGGTLNDPETVVRRITFPASAVKAVSHFWTPPALMTTLLVANGTPGHHVGDGEVRVGLCAMAASDPVINNATASAVTTSAAPA
jgi:hypothetical protein